MKRSPVKWLSALVIPLVLASSTTAMAKTKLTVWNPQGAGPWQTAFEELAKKYEKINPNVDVSIVVMDWSFMEKLILQATVATGPDLALIAESHLGKLAWRGFLTNLEPYIKNDRIRMSDFHKVTTDAYRYKYKKMNGQFGLPILYSGYAMLYNKTMFREAGIAFPTSKWNVDAFKEYALRLTRDTNGDGKPDKYGLDIQNHQNRFVGFIRSYGGDIMDEVKDEFVMDTPEAAAAVQLFGDLHFKHNAVLWNGFSKNQTAMQMASGFGIGNLRKLPFDFDVAPVPLGPTGLRSAALPTNGIVMPTYAKHKKEAWNFIKYLTSRDAQEYMAKLGLAIPVYAPASNAFIDPKEKPANQEVFVESVKYGRPAGVAPYADEVFSVLVNKPIADVCSGKTNAVTAIRQVAPQIKQIIAKYKARM